MTDMSEDNSTAIQDDIVDHELLATHDQIAQLRQQLETALAARDSIARDFLAASQAEERVRRERDDARAAGGAYRRDRDRWKAAAAAHGCAAPGPCDHYRSKP